MRGILRCTFAFANRTLIEPQIITFEPYEDRFKVASPTHEFLISRKPISDKLFVHEVGTPSAVLKKAGIHIIPDSVPELNRREKISAVSRQLQANYENAFKSCKTPKEIFHQERRIKMEIRNKLSFIGCLSGKYKHFLCFKPFLDITAQITQKEYEKNGVMVDKLGEQIYPSGKVWLPTSEKYLVDYCNIVNSMTGKQTNNVLDVGCGSGILSYLFAKSQKKSHIYAIDKNPDAVKTTNVNAARLNMKNIEAFEFDVKNQAKIEIELLGAKFPKAFDWILINPPWLAASRLDGDSAIGEGVYDQKSAMLENSMKLAKRLLAKDGKIVVIYSDLAKLIGLVDRTLQDICQEHGLLIEQKREQPFQEELGRRSALQQFKTRAKIITYVIRHC